MPGITAQIPTPFLDRVVQLCDTQDIVCDSSLDASTEAHTSYDPAVVDTLGAAAGRLAVLHRR